MIGLKFLGLVGVMDALDANLLSLEDDFPKVIGHAVSLFQKEVKQRAHVLTGTLRDSIRGETKGLRGIVFVDPSATNPRGGKPIDYAPMQDAKYGLFSNAIKSKEKIIVGAAISLLEIK